MPLPALQDSLAIARSLWLSAGLPLHKLSTLKFTPTSGADPAVNSSFRLGTVAQVRNNFASHEDRAVGSADS